MSRRSGPRIRSLKPEFWQDERFVGVNLAAQLTYVGLHTQADDEGRQTANTALIKARVFPLVDVTETQIGAWLDELAAAGLIVRYSDAGRAYVAIVSWLEDQRIDRPTPSVIPPPPGVPRDSSRGLANAPAGPDRDQDRDQDPDAGGSAADEKASDDVRRLSDLLAELVRARDPKFNGNPSSARWLTDMRLLVENDRQGDVAEVERVLRWSQADPFWQANVLSPGGLRKHFTQLVAKASNGRNGAAAPTQRSARADELDRAAGLLA